MEQPVLIRLRATGTGINFPEYDEGDGFDVIEKALLQFGLKRRKTLWSTPLEEVREYKDGRWSVVLEWDGYFTDLVMTKGGGSLLDLFVEMGRCPAFRTEISPDRA